MWNGKKTYQIIKELRTRAKVTQKELAEKVGLSQQAIALIENGKRKIDIDLYLKIIDILDPKRSLLPTITCDNSDYFKDVFWENLETTYTQLSSNNKERLIRYSKKLLSIQEMEKELETTAAHDRTDVENTPEGRQHDIDLLNDDSKWKQTEQETPTEE